MHSKVSFFSEKHSWDCCWRFCPVKLEGAKLYSHTLNMTMQPSIHYWLYNWSVDFYNFMKRFGIAWSRRHTCTKFKTAKWWRKACYELNYSFWNCDKYLQQRTEPQLTVLGRKWFLTAAVELIIKRNRCPMLMYTLYKIMGIVMSQAWI